MPILEYRLTAGRHTDEQIGELLLASAKLYADVLKSPVERVRVTAQMHRPQHAVVGGRLLDDGSPAAPYFQFLVLEGRPLDECHALIAGFTELVVSLLGVDRALVRGGCWPIPPQYWGIGGTPASVLRAQEIAARAAAAGQDG
jgi:phenylpyruvate tautomerase PptA (4-oxalocrotonate tautomerase family)